MGPVRRSAHRARILRLGRRRQRGMAMLETIVFFGAVLLLYAAASVFGQRWQAVHQSQHVTQAALFDAAWGRPVQRDDMALAGGRTLDVLGRREMEQGFGELLRASVGAVWALIDDDDYFPVEPFTGRLQMHQAQADSTLHPPRDERPAWLDEQPITHSWRMPASTPECWWPHTFLFDAAVGHYTWAAEAATSLGDFDRPLLNWGI